MKTADVVIQLVIGSLSTTAPAAADCYTDTGDIGLELSSITSATPSARIDTALELDVVAAAFRERIAENGCRRPLLSRPELEFHNGVLYSPVEQRFQYRLGLGSGVGPLGLAVSTAIEVDDGSGSIAVGPELRLRHRFDGFSIGALLRIDSYLFNRDVHEDRFALGLFAMLDLL